MPQEVTLSTFDEELIGSHEMEDLLERLQSSGSLSADEVLEILNNCTLPMLLKLVDLLNVGAASINYVPTLYLPIDSWLDENDPVTVLKRAIGRIRRQRIEPQRLIVQIEDYSDLEHLWPDIIDELRSAITLDVTMVAPDPERLMQWINKNDLTGSRTVRRYQFERKLERMLEAGFDALTPTSQSTLLTHIQEVGFPVAARTHVDELTRNVDMARKLVRLRQSLIGEVELHTWIPSIAREQLQVTPQAVVDLLLIRAHLIGALIYPGTVHVVDGAAMSMAAVDFLVAAGISGQVGTTFDQRTARDYFCQFKDAPQKATVVAGSF